ncbi:MAG: hypothetical protein ACKV2V_29885, partial [Blastocatellia bacterium]
TTGNVYIAGSTGSTSYPTLSPLQANSGGGVDMFLTKINPNQNVAAFVTVSAASYRADQLAPEAIVAGFGVSLSTGPFEGTDTDPNTDGIQLPTTLGGTTVNVRDSNGVTRPAPLFFVSPGQINYQMPTGTASGRASITVNGAGAAILGAGVVNMAATGPGLFTANALGSGAPAGYAIRVKTNGQQTFESIASGATPIEIDMGPAGEQIFLVLFGTGIRGRLAQGNVQVSYFSGSTFVAASGVEFADRQGFLIGLDQINLILPRTLVGRGELDVVIRVAGATSTEDLNANAIKIRVR